MSWQEKLDEMFPDGVIVTLVEPGDPPGFTDDSSSYLTPKLEVLEESDHPLVRFMVADYSRDFRFVLVGLEEFSAGVWTAHTQDPHPDFMLSSNLGPETRSGLRGLRAEWYPDEHGKEVV